MIPRRRPRRDLLRLSFVLMLVLAPAAGALPGCATGRGLRDAAFLRLDCNVPDATLWIDDHPAGHAAAWREARPMPAGFRRLELRHPGYFTFYKELSTQPGDTVVLTARLQPELE
jgi:hypothetical protein